MTLLRHTEYVNTSFAGVTRSGLPFAFVGGKHEAGFPYDTPESEWDELDEHMRAPRELERAREEDQAQQLMKAERERP